MDMRDRVALWDAINRYVVTCCGDPSKHVYGNTPRQKAVVDVEAAIRVIEERRASTAAITDRCAHLADSATPDPGMETDPCKECGRYYVDE